MSLIYIGAFPPGWGGVTIKNRDLYDALAENGIPIKKIDLHKITRKKSIKETFRLGYAILGRHNRYVIGISTGMRRRFTHLLYVLNRRAMRRSIMIVMGGTASQDIVENRKFMRWASEYKRIYVETASMAKILEDAGMKNIALYPNCRHESRTPFVKSINSGKLNCVFFSYIQMQKGVDIILEAAGELKNVGFVFWGNVDPTYENEFYQQIDRLPNCNYKGIFKGENESVYRELREYDILLFPTRWDTEGVPGILVEAKIAGLPCIVSNKSYNAELIKDGVEGIVMQTNDSESLIRGINSLDHNREMLLRMSHESHNSAEEYYIEKYVSIISDDLL